MNHLTEMPPLATSNLPFNKELMMDSGFRDRTMTVSRDNMLRNEQAFSGNVTLKPELLSAMRNRMNVSETFANKRGQSAGYNKRGQNMKNDSNLKKVYGRMVELASADENHSGNHETSYRQRRGQSGRPGGRNKVTGLENIYLSKIPKSSTINNAPIPSVKKHFAGERRSEHNPFRPTLQQFEDDPGQLNVNTKMDKSDQGGMDVWKMVEDLDQM